MQPLLAIGRSDLRAAVFNSGKSADKSWTKQQQASDGRLVGQRAGWRWRWTLCWRQHWKQDIDQPTDRRVAPLSPSRRPAPAE